MGQGKGSVLAITLLLCIFLIQSEIALAKVYYVGDAKGWTFNVNTWTKGKVFRAGDTLVFKYPQGAHNVVDLKNNKVAYNWCLKPKGSKSYQTGKDIIKLIKGYNYFMCSFPGHCKAGIRIAIQAV